MKTLFYSLLILLAAALPIASWMHWIPFSVIESMGFVTGLGCVALAVRQNIWNFAFGIANNLFYLVLFWRARLYGDAGLQIIYILFALRGWYFWSRGSASLKIRRITPRGFARTCLMVLLSTALLAWTLRLVNGAAPLLDALTTALSLGAQYLFNRKFLENWWLWITADVIYIGLYTSRGLHLTAALYFIFFILCVMGWREWKREFAKA